MFQAALRGGKSVFTSRNFDSIKQPLKGRGEGSDGCGTFWRDDPISALFFPELIDGGKDRRKVATLLKVVGKLFTARRRAERDASR